MTTRTRWHKAEQFEGTPQERIAIITKLIDVVSKLLAKSEINAKADNVKKAYNLLMNAGTRFTYIKRLEITEADPFYDQFCELGGEFDRLMFVVDAAWVRSLRDPAFEKRLQNILNGKI